MDNDGSFGGASAGDGSAGIGGMGAGPTPPGSAGAGPAMGAPSRMAFCVHCGASLAGVAVEGVCPSCGAPVKDSFAVGASGSGSDSGLAVASMVVGIVSVVGCMFYGLPSIVCGPVAIVLAQKAKNAIRDGRRSPSGSGFAQAGLITGIVGSVLGFLGLALIVFAMIAGFAGSGP